MAEADHPEQVVEEVQCFDKKIYGYFDEEGLSRLAFSSWHTLAGAARVGEHADGELSLDGKLDMLKLNLTKFEKSLRDRRINHIPEFLKNNGLQHPLVHPWVVTAVCSYLLYLVSCHSDLVIVNSACNTLSYHLETGAVFAPDRAQILTIALNMGMKEEFLPDFSRDELPQYVRDQRGAASRARDQYPQPFHVRQVVGCLSELLQAGRGWTDAARDTLFSVLVAMLIDPYMERILMTSHVTICLDRLLQSYHRTTWSDGSDNCKALDLLDMLDKVLPAAARLPVLAGLPRLGRGLQLSRLAGYLYLQRTIFEQLPSGVTGSEVFFDMPQLVTVGGVLSVIRGEQLGGLPRADFSSKTSGQLRSCYAVLRCADAAVGSERLPLAQLGHLQQLRELLQSKVDTVKEYEDRTLELRIKLKDFMAMLHSKWDDMSKTPSRSW